VAGGSLALSPHALLLLSDRFLVSLGLLGVLLGKGPLLGGLAPMLVHRLTELLRPGGVRVGFLAVAGGLGGEPLAFEPSLLRPAAHQRDGERDQENRGDDDGDDENRRHLTRLPVEATGNRGAEPCGPRHA
jgi:hypothetical protein